MRTWTTICWAMFAVAGPLTGCQRSRPADVSAVLAAPVQPKSMAAMSADRASPDVVQAADLAEAGAAAARVNGQPVSRESLVNLLIEAHGREMLQAMVALDVAKQAAQRKGVRVTAADIAAEEASSYPAELKSLPPKERERVLDDYLERNHLTRVHWRLAIQRNAHLRKLSQDVPKPTEKQLREIFRRRYGQRIQVRHLQVDALKDIQLVEARLKRGDKFEEVAKDLSTNRATGAKGGLLPPFTRDDDTVPAELREVAFTLKDDGEVSSRIIDRGYHLLQLVKRFPPDKEKFEDVRDRLANEVNDALVRRKMNHLLRLLPATAEIEILDPIIKAQVEKEQSSLPQPVSAPPGDGPGQPGDRP